MSGARKAAVFIVLLALGVLVFAKLHTLSKSGAPSAIAASRTQQVLAPVDLAQFYDNDPSFDAPGCWQAVPRGLQTLGNIPFRIAGLIQLWGEGPQGIGRNYRESVEGIPASGKFQTLYVLHGTSFTTAQGAPIAAVVFRYADGSAATNLIHYWTDSRDWWEPMAENNPLPTNSPSKVVWRGDHPSLPDWAKSLRLFGTGITNPRPKSEVKGVDLVSTKSRVTWLVLAMTTGPAGALQADPQLEKNELPAEQIEVNVVALDAATEKPIPGVRFKVTLQTGRRSRPYGAFRADEHGQSTIDLPPERIRLLAIEAFGSNHTSEQMSWNVEKGETIPTNYVFRLSKEAP